MRRTIALLVVVAGLFVVVAGASLNVRLFFDSTSNVVPSPDIVLAQEQTTPPEMGEQQAVLSADGAALKAGWNYLRVGFAGCSVKNVLDELQADGGSALEAGSLFVREGGEWKQYSLINPSVETTEVTAGQLLAFYANQNFYFDLEQEACINPDAKRVAQIEQVRGNAEEQQQESLAERIGSFPLELWGRLLELLTDTSAGQQGEGSLERLNVLGESTFSDVTITGSIQLGLLSLESLESESSGASIQTLAGPLRLQQSGLGDIEAFGGKIVLDKKGDVIVEGNVEAKEIKAREKLCVGETCVTEKELKRLLEMKK